MDRPLSLFGLAASTASRSPAVSNKLFACDTFKGEVTLVQFIRCILVNRIGLIDGHDYLIFQMGKDEPNGTTTQQQSSSLKPSGSGSQNNKEEGTQFQRWFRRLKFRLTQGSTSMISDSSKMNGKVGPKSDKPSSGDKVSK